MVKLTCSDYGFDCCFEVEGEIQKAVDEFVKHTREEHAISYGKVI